MSFLKRMLGPGEEVVLESRPHWSVIVPRSVGLAAVLAGCITVVVLWSSAPVWIGYLLAAVGALAALWFLVRFVRWRTSWLVITTRRVVYRTGMLQRTGREIPLSRVQDVTYRQSLFERLIGTGDLTVESAGEGGSAPFPQVKHPDRIQSVISQLMSAQPPAQPRDGGTFGRLRRRPEEPPPAMGAPSVAEQIEQLAHLHRSGVVTDAEFEAKKRELLGRL